MKAGVCMTENCAKKGMPLAQCECSDGAHKGKQNAGAGQMKAQDGEVGSRDDDPAEKESKESKSGE